ncbi:MAG TPA: hypothetical protein VFX10_03600, partial [Nitrospira sp.]|nr:hypothetical protein [Nitrospira sp.]
MRRVLSLLQDALALLHADGDDGTSSEPDLNRRLFECLLKANENDRRRGGNRYFDYPPTWEGRNPPTPDTLDTTAELKIPDFYWGYLDHDEPDAARCARNFVIECKRLGSVTGSGRALNLCYVEYGVVRFVHPAWRYGKDVADGAMVGYIQSMDPDGILADVNSAARQRCLPELCKDELERGVIWLTLSHSLSRPFEVTPF